MEGMSAASRDCSRRRGVSWAGGSRRGGASKKAVNGDALR
jgi:hypothetical protein